MKTGVLILLICTPLFLSCAERKAEHSEEAVRQATAVNSAPQNTRSNDSLIAEGKATKLAKGAAKRLLGSLEKYDVITSEVDNGWRITVHLKDNNKHGAILGGATEFIVDKEGEQITDVKLYQ
jgi:hypothetical protein